MAEWLRRWTRNPLGSARAGSNPADYVFSPFSFFILLSINHGHLYIVYITGLSLSAEERKVSHGVDEFEHVFEADVLQPQPLQLLPLAAQQSLARLQVLLERSDLLLRVWGRPNTCY